MKDFLNKNLVSLIVLALLVVVYLQRCGGGSPVAPLSTHDTVTLVYHHYHDSTIVSKPTIINHIVAGNDDIPSNMVPDSTYVGLRRQYDSLSQEYYSRNIAQDSIQIDTTGWVRTTDTTQRNRIVGRKWDYHFDIREKLTTITNTIYPPIKRQVYIGGGILGNEKQLVMGGKAGLFYKDRKDRVFGAGVTILKDHPIIYDLNAYWKLRFGGGSP